MEGLLPILPSKKFEKPLIKKKFTWGESSDFSWRNFLISWAKWCWENYYNEVYSWSSLLRTPEVLNFLAH